MQLLMLTRVVNIDHRKRHHAVADEP